MRTGKQMVVAAMNIQQKTMGFPVPLTGFAKAYDGAPVDNVKYEESRRQLMEMFRKRQQESRRQGRRGAAEEGSAADGARTGPSRRTSARQCLRPRRRRSRRRRLSSSSRSRKLAEIKQAAPVRRGGLSFLEG